MKKNLSDYLVAITVVFCSLVLLGALTVALGGFRLKKPSRTLQIDYADVKGVHLATELRYAGAPAGHVVDIRLLSADERHAAKDPANAVRVTVEIDDNIPPVPADVMASIDSDTLLSEKFVSLSAGTVNGQTLANNAIIQGHAAGIDELLNGGGALMEKVNALLASVQGDLKDIMPRLGVVLDNVKDAVASGETLLNNANKLVDKDGSLHAALDGAREAVEKLKGVEGDLDVLIKGANQNLDGRMKELGVVLQNLKVATTYLKAFSQSIGEKPNRIIFTTKGAKLQSESDILKSQKPLPAKAPEQAPSPAQ